MRSIAYAAAISAASATLVACGSSGGGGAGPSSVQQSSTASSAGGASSGATFTSFAATPANQPVVIDGVAATASGTHTVASDDITVNSVAFNRHGPGTAQLTEDTSGDLKAITISTQQSSVTFDRDTPDHEFTCSGKVCAAVNPTAAAIAADPGANGWNYQTFGIWAVKAGPTSWTAGAMSVGAPTPGNAVPTVGSATFKGSTAALFVNSSGTPFATEADVTANVNFGTQSIGFSTSKTSTLNLNSGSIKRNDPSLNLSGTLSYAPGANSFDGKLTAKNGISGPASGRFYGPAAQEMGGVYSLQGTAGSMLGGFGAARP